jgi:hypothetical protein
VTAAWKKLMHEPVDTESYPLRITEASYRAVREAVKRLSEDEYGQPVVTFTVPVPVARNLVTAVWAYLDVQRAAHRPIQSGLEGLNRDLIDALTEYPVPVTYQDDTVTHPYRVVVDLSEDATVRGLRVAVMNRNGVIAGVTGCHAEGYSPTFEVRFRTIQDRSDFCDHWTKGVWRLS